MTESKKPVREGSPLIQVWTASEETLKQSEDDPRAALPPRQLPSLEEANEEADRPRGIELATQSTPVPESTTTSTPRHFPSVDETPQACIECSRRSYVCDIASLPCPRCSSKKLPCIGPLRPNESYKAGIRRQVTQIREIVRAQTTKAYGVMWYLAKQFGEGQEGWDALRDFMGTGKEEDAEEREEIQQLRMFVVSVRSSDFRLWLEWREAGKPGELDPALRHFGS